MSTHEEQDRLGNLYAALSALVGKPVDLVNEAMPGLVATYGKDDVAWALGVLAEDVQSVVAA